jgi:serine/threonine protein kinase
MTAHGGNPGTPGYKSPEQEAGQRALTVKSDVFSLAITAYELRANAHPYLYQQHLIGHRIPFPLRDVVPGIDIGLSDLVARMMDNNPVLRPGPAEIGRAI